MSLKDQDARHLLLACSVCLRRHAGTSRGALVRHGFSVVGSGGGRGHLGAWHTGPCWGADHPHLGISTAGTALALQAVRRQIEVVGGAILALDARPVLQWTRTITDRTQGRSFGGKYPTRTETRDVKPGDEREYLADHGHTVPSYEDLLATRRQDLHRSRDDLRRSEAEYVRVIDTWTPEAYAPAPRPPKVRTLHAAATWERGSRTAIVPRCQRSAMRPAYGPTTDDRALVTCTRCQKQLGAPP